MRAKYGKIVSIELIALAVFAGACSGDGTSADSQLAQNCAPAITALTLTASTPNYSTTFDTGPAIDTKTLYDGSVDLSGVSGAATPTASGTPPATTKTQPPTGGTFGEKIVRELEKPNPEGFDRSQRYNDDSRDSRNTDVARKPAPTVDCGPNASTLPTGTAGGTTPYRTANSKGGASVPSAPTGSVPAPSVYDVGKVDPSLLKDYGQSANPSQPATIIKDMNWGGTTVGPTNTPQDSGTDSECLKSEGAKLGCTEEE